MLYLIDANVLIRAHEDYYPLDRVPQFWTWLEQNALVGQIKMPFEIYDEIAISRGPLKDWICGHDIRAACKTLSDSDRRKTAQVSAHSGARQLSRF